jgi:chromosome partitioning protein
MPSVIAAINLKGGVGKTSACFHLAGELARTGHRVLAVDNDPQGSLTAAFHGPTEARRLDPAGTIAAVYNGADPLPEAVIRPTPFAGIDLLPGSRFAADHNNARPHAAPFEIQVCLRDFLDQVRNNYAVVLIDCPPNLNVCSWAAMTAADAYLVPLQPEDFGAQGVTDVTEAARGVQALSNPGLRLLGYVVSMYQARRAIHQAYVERLRGAFGRDVFDAMIPEAVDFVEAVTALKPVGFLKPRGVGARAVRAVAEELMVRLTAPAVAGAGGRPPDNGQAR